MYGLLVSPKWGSHTEKKNHEGITRSESLQKLRGSSRGLDEWRQVGFSWKVSPPLFRGPVVSPEYMASFLNLSGREKGSQISAFGLLACAWARGGVSAEQAVLKSTTLRAC